MALVPTEPAQPIAGYLGGKRLLAKKIIERIEAIPHQCYAEPFVGMGGVFLRRARRPSSGEIINDIDGDIANLFRCMQHHSNAVIEGLEWALSCRDEYVRQFQVDPKTLTDIQRAVRFIYLQRHAFGGKSISAGPGFAVNRTSPARMATGKMSDMIGRAHRRLSTATIENLDFQTFIERYDRPGTLFYVDPPYDGHENDYGPGRFSPTDLDRLAAVLRAVQGCFILSINDTDRMRELFHDCSIEEAETKYSTHRPSDRSLPVGELIITGP